MALRRWLADRIIGWGWARLTPDQRRTFLDQRRSDLIATLTIAEHLALLETVLTPTARTALALGLLAGLPPKTDPYVY